MKLPTPREIAKKGIANWKKHRKPCDRCAGCGEEWCGDHLALCSVCDGGGEAVDPETYVALAAYEAIEKACIQEIKSLQAAIQLMPMASDRMINARAIADYYDISTALRKALEATPK